MPWQTQTNRSLCHGRFVAVVLLWRRDRFVAVVLSRSFLWLLWSVLKYLWCLVSFVYPRSTSLWSAALPGGHEGLLNIGSMPWTVSTSMWRNWERRLVRVSGHRWSMVIVWPLHSPSWLFVWSRVVIWEAVAYFWEIMFRFDSSLTPWKNYHELSLELS